MEDKTLNSCDFIMIIEIKDYLSSIEGIKDIKSMSKKDLNTLSFFLDAWIEQYKYKTHNKLESFKDELTANELETITEIDDMNVKYSMNFLGHITGFAVDLYHGSEIEEGQLDLSFIGHYILIDTILNIDKLEYEYITDKAILKAKEFVIEIFKDHKYKIIIETYLSMLLEFIIKELYKLYKNKRLDKLIKELAKKNLDMNKHNDEQIAKIKKELKIFDDEYTKESYRYEDLDDIINEVVKELFKNDIEGVLRDYDYQPNSAATQFIKNRVIAKNTKQDKLKLNKNIKVFETPNLETGHISYDYIGKKEDYNIIFEDLNALKSRQSVNFRKTLNFILQKANEQNIPQNIFFDLSEYQKNTGYKSKDTAYRGAVRNFETLRGISIGGTIKKGSKEIRNKTSYIFIAKDITYNQCFIECKPHIVEMLSQYFTLLPKWAGELNTKAYDLLDYIFYMARQTQNIFNIRKDNKFNISMKAINNYIGGHDPEDTERHAQLIIDPILNAIEEIEDTQRGEKLKITPIYNHNYKNAFQFLEGGYIEIELGEEAGKYFCDRSQDREKKIKKAIKK